MSFFDDEFGGSYIGNPNPYGYTPPAEWLTALDQTAPGLVDAMSQQNVTPSQDWITTALRTASTVVMTVGQSKLLNIQLDRAAKGLPPLDASAYTPGVAVNVGIDPQLRNGLLLGGAVLIGWLVMKKR